MFALGSYVDSIDTLGSPLRTPNDKFFEKLLMAILFTLRGFARNLLRENRRRRNTFHIFLF